MTFPPDRHDIALVMVPQFPLLSLAICTESLRVANRELGRTAFSRTLVSLDGDAVHASSGLPMAAESALADIRFAPIVILLASYRVEEAAAPALLHWLRRQDRRGALLVAVDNAAYLLAEEGLLKGHAVAAHRESLPAYDHLFEGAAVLDRTHTLEERRATSSGGMATLDMMLGLIARLEDEALADRVAHVLNYRRPTERFAPAALPGSRSGAATGGVGAGNGAGNGAGDGAIARVDRRLARMVELMQAHLEAPLPLEAICRAAHVDTSTARRLFQRRLRMSPRDYYRRMRLERARALLTNSALGVADIAERTGFADPSSFSRAYKRVYGILPSKDRRAASGM